MHVLFTCTHWTSVGERHDWVVRFDPQESLDMYVLGRSDVILQKIEKLLYEKCPRISCQQHSAEQVVINAFIPSNDGKKTGPAPGAMTT